MLWWTRKFANRPDALRQVLETRCNMWRQFIDRLKGLNPFQNVSNTLVRSRNVTRNLLARDLFDPIITRLGRMRRNIVDSFRDNIR
jgi:hypothetical protein